jgi:hypothetical protein
MMQRFAEPRLDWQGKQTAAVALSLLLFLVWTTATYLLEGRIGLLRQPTLIGRWIYVVVANILIGTVAAAWVLRSLLISGLVTLDQLGFRSPRRTLCAVVIAAVLGFGIFLLQKPVSLKWVVLLNAFTQVLQTSIAEVLVCWVAVGTSVEALTRGKSRVISLLVAILATDLLFGIYHFAHSAPFNQPQVALFLMIPGLATSLIYFLGRDVYATILFHNYLGMTGVMRSVDLTLFQQPLYSIYLLTFISIIGLVGIHIFLLVKRNSRDNQKTA